MGNSSVDRRDTVVFSASVQTGFFLLLCILLIVLIGVMIVATIGYDYLITVVNKYISDAQASASSNETLALILNIDGVGKQVVEVLDSIKQMEMKAAEVLTFSFIHFVPFVIGLFVVFITTISRFKTGFDLDESEENKEYIFTSFLNFFGCIILLLIFAVVIVSPFISDGLIYKLLIPFIINFVLLVLLYYSTVKKERTFMKIFVSSVISSVGIVLCFYVIKYMSSLLSFGSVSLLIMMYVVFFVLSLVIVPYIVLKSYVFSSGIVKI